MHGLLAMLLIGSNAITNDNKLLLVKLRFQAKVAISDKNFSREDVLHVRSLYDNPSSQFLIRIFHAKTRSREEVGASKNGRSRSQLAKKDTGSIFFAPSRLKRESAWLFAKS